MFNDDIFSLILSAEESMLKAELGVEDSYEAYVMESAVEETIAMEAEYVDSYGWDMAIEEATTATANSMPSSASGDRNSTFGEKVKAAGEWLYKGIQTILKKAAEAWGWLKEQAKNLFERLFKRQKEVEYVFDSDDDDRDYDDIADDTDNTADASNSTSQSNAPASTKNLGHVTAPRLERSSREIVAYKRGEVTTNSTDDNTSSSSSAQARLGTSKGKSTLGLPDHKEFNKALPSRQRMAQIIKSNRKNGITESQINKVKTSTDKYAKSIFSFIQKGLDVANSAAQIMDQLRTLKFNTLNKENKIKEFEDKFENLENSIKEIDAFNSEIDSVKSAFDDAIGDVPHWNVYIDAKTIHGFSGMVKNIHDATTRHEEFCNKFIKFVDDHKNESGAQFKNPQELRVDGKTISGGVVIGSAPTNLIYKGSKLYLSASTSVNKVVNAYRSLINNIVASD